MMLPPSAPNTSSTIQGAQVLTTERSASPPMYPSSGMPAWKAPTDNASHSAARPRPLRSTMP